MNIEYEVFFKVYINMFNSIYIYFVFVYIFVLKIIYSWGIIERFVCEDKIYLELVLYLFLLSF